MTRRSTGLDYSSEGLVESLRVAGLGAEVDMVDSWGAGPQGHRLVLTRARLGQYRFRERLLTQMGAVCAISGENPASVLEAAHLYSYAELGRHHDHGGLLLRRDLHRLFDGGLLTIHPASGEVVVSADLLRFPTYAAFEGQKAQVRLTEGHRMWLKSRWVSFERVA